MDPLDPGWKGKYGWSVSSDRLWQTCRRAFYYQYVAPWQASAERSERERLFRLRGLTGLKLLEGRLVHETAENLVNQHRLGRSLQVAPAVAFYDERVRAYKGTSRDTVVEAYNGLLLRDEFWELIRNDGAAQLGNFIQIIWPNLADLEYLQHEEFENFYLQDIKVNVKVDYTTRSQNGIVVVTDWKTGQDFRPEEGNVQLAVYGLWAASKFQVPLGKVRLELAYLRTGRSYPVELTEDLVRDAKEAVTAGAAEVLAAEDLDDFPTSPDPDKCTSCKFATVCPAGKGILEQFFADSVKDVVAKLGRKGGKIDRKSEDLGG